ncbi:MAG: class I SAM-dependent methyltransferase, partial [Oscillospiraceae bacterium]|nr:class I SAM-dependent methyltransferase [Oscillospiraceae bacterium]
MGQNFFDISEVFDGYQKLRGSDINCNTLMEQPEMTRLLPDVRGKTVLDLGCGYGHNCVQFC